MSSVEQSIEKQISDAEAQLQELFSQTVTCAENLTSPSPRPWSVGKNLAEYYTFEIEALEKKKNPLEYIKLGYCYPTNTEYVFGSHYEDISTPDFDYDWKGKLKQGDGVVVWRKIGLPNYIRITDL